MKADTPEQVQRAKTQLKRLALNAGPQSNAAVLVRYVEELEELRDGPA